MQHFYEFILLIISILTTPKLEILINKNDVHKMDLNSIDTRTLKNHPYINDWNLANSIVKMREQKERYSTIKEIKESVLMNDSIFKRIEPYLIIK